MFTLPSDPARPFRHDCDEEAAVTAWLAAARGTLLEVAEAITAVCGEKPTAHEAAAVVAATWIEEARDRGVPEDVDDVLTALAWAAADQLDQQLAAELS